MRRRIRENAIKNAIREGGRARGFHLGFSEPSLIEILANLPFDFVYLDGEHGRFTLRELEECCRAAELFDLTVLYRIPEIEPNLISQILNAGVSGLIAPHVDTADDVRRLVDASLMAPEGHRPNGGSRSNRYWHGIGDLPAAIAEVNANISLSIQIESRQAVDAIDDILQVEGVDYYTIGKADLAQSLGLPRLPSGHHPDVLAVVAAVEQRIRARGGRLKDDVMAVGRVREFMIQGARRFFAEIGGEAGRAAGEAR